MISSSDPIYNFLLLFAFPQSGLLTIENTKSFYPHKNEALTFVIHATAEVKSRIL